MAYISALIITLNEERNIERCIRSLEGVADEIVVLDSGSTDSTLAICKQLNVKTISTSWKGYAATKNEGHAALTHDWVLSLDADEALSEELKKSILQHKSNLSGAYRFCRLTNYCGKFIYHGGWYPDKKIRLFHRKQASWKGQYVHEELTVNPEVSVTDLNGDLLHYSYYTFQEHVERSEKYARLGAEKIAAKGKSVEIKIIFSPVVRFIQMFILKAGFLDGYYGLKISLITAREVKRKYQWAKQLMKNKG